MILALAAVFLLCLTRCTVPVAATPYNISIDDTMGDPFTGEQWSYYPSDAWNVGQDCNGCTAHPDPIGTYLGTWHDSTFYPQTGISPDPDVPTTATIVFNGTALYVYCIIAHSSVSPDGNTDMTFMIDNHIVGGYMVPPTGQTAYDYNVLVYSNDTLPLGFHTFTLINGHVNGNKSLVLLDRAIAKIDDVVSPSSNGFTIVSSSATSSFPSSTSSSGATSASSISSVSSASSVTHTGGVLTASHGLSKENRTIIIAVVSSVGGAVVMVAIGFTFWFCRRRQHGRGQYGPPTEGQIPRTTTHIANNDPNAPDSGWVEGTWRPEETPHPSLSPLLYGDSSPRSAASTSKLVLSSPSLQARGLSRATSTSSAAANLGVLSGPRPIPSSTSSQNRLAATHSPPAVPGQLTRSRSDIAITTHSPAPSSLSEPATASTIAPLVRSQSDIVPPSRPAFPPHPFAYSHNVGAITEEEMASTELASPTNTSNADFIDWSVPSTPWTPARSDSVRTVSLTAHRLPDTLALGNMSTAAEDAPSASLEPSPDNYTDDGRTRRRFGIIGPRPPPSSFKNARR
ncbi:hypothetical protein CERSUDRAFT_89999 [Gelatoporia subvermispora B]|uniref:Uncharacterized protein n=1 Tax=Ceriporiopsis subvermispora (strain B) TaxID=914234 RepID=M2PX79_CERS8|nr:hypothetical protein CERSUDRAFT_89999 [Gelatoporia subvermispora B]